MYVSLSTCGLPSAIATIEKDELLLSDANVLVHIL